MRSKQTIAIYVRVSSKRQDTRSQEPDLQRWADAQQQPVRWYRDKATGKSMNRPSWNKLEEAIQQGKVSTVVCWRIDRLGRTAKLELTQQDDYTLMRVFINAVKSSKERRDLSYRSMRKKVPLFLDTGSWPTGVQPFGFGKRCYDSDGKRLIWEWQPTTRTTGRLYYPDKRGRLKLAQDDIGVPRKEKEKRWITKLVPSENKDFIKTVRLVFNLFAITGLSLRAISARLNREGRLFYDKPFTHSLVAQILANAAYVGDTHYGKTQSASYWTYNSKGEVVRPAAEPEDDTATPKEKRRAKPRQLSEQLVKQNTHKGLIDRKLWDLSQAKLHDERRRTSFSPQNPAHYLNQIFVCGHCGANMTGTPETDQRTKKKTIVYMCSNYRKSRSAGQPLKCKSYRIRHDKAEQMLLDKLRELNIQYDQLTSEMARSSVREELAELKKPGPWSVGRWFDVFSEGVDALSEYYRDHHDSSKKKLAAFSKQIENYYSASPAQREGFTKRLRDVVTKAESESVKRATERMARLKREHATTVKNWNDPDVTESTKAVLKGEIKKLEVEIVECEPLTRTITQRLNDVTEAGNAVRARREHLLAEIPKLESRERGEAYRRVFKKVTLYWDEKFVKRSDKPKRPLKTNRPGRDQRKLRADKIEWELAEVDLSGSL